MGDRELELDKSEIQRIGKYLFEPLEEIDNLNACIEEGEEMLQKARDKVEELKREIENKDIEIVNLKKHVEELKGEVIDLAFDNEALKQSRMSMKDVVSELYDSL